MLTDLEKRDAFLKENQDRVLDGLYSAYDLELEADKKWYSTSLWMVSIFILTMLILASYYFFSDNLLQSNSSIPAITSIDNKLGEYNTDIIVETGSKVLEKKNDVPDNNDSNSFLKLDSSLLIETSSSVRKLPASIPLNRIDKVFFEKDEEGISLVIKLPQEIDYLVYGLSSPNRIVIEVKHAELGFLLEELKPVEPIVAIRYSINEENRFKLVLETDEPLNIRKTIAGGNNELVVVMEYEPSSKLVDRKDEKLFDSMLDEIVDSNRVFEQETVYKGELVKTPVSQDVNAYAEKLFRQGYRDYKNGDISKSLKRLNMALDQDAAHVNARATLATILSRQGHVELAYTVLNEGLIQYPEQIEWLTIYARLLLNEDKELEAFNVLAKSSPALSSNIEFYALKAAVLQKINEHTESAKIYRDLLQINPSKSVWWMGLGISLESLKRYSDALYAYQKASTNSSLVNESRNFVQQRITMITNLIRDESS